MRELFVLLNLVVFNSVLIAQEVNSFHYVLMLRDSLGSPLNDELLTVEVLLYDNSQEDSLIYRETHNVLSNSKGFVKIDIGKGEEITGTYESIKWGLSTISIELVMITQYEAVVLKSEILRNVSYSLYAEDVPSRLSEQGDTLFIGTSFVKLPSTLSNTQFCSDSLACNYSPLGLSSSYYCIYPGSNCDDRNLFTVNDVLDEDCKCSGIVHSNGIFTTSDSISDVDGNVYQTIEINNSIWTQQNLSVSHFSNGDSISTNYSDVNWATLSEPAYASYSNQEIPEMGKLYNWYAVHDIRGLCPTNWHVATAQEWIELITFLDPSISNDSIPLQSFIAGGQLKSKNYWNAPNVGATNETQFFAMPGGYRHRSGYYNHLGNIGHYWSSTEYNVNSAYFVDMYTGNSSIKFGSIGKKYGFSVRCVKN